MTALLKSQKQHTSTKAPAKVAVQGGWAGKNYSVVNSKEAQG